MARSRAVRLAARVAVVTAVVAGTLVPAVVAPAKTVRVPKVLARTARLVYGEGRLEFAMRPTHIAFSWAGENGTGVEYRLLGTGQQPRWRRAPENEDARRGARHYSVVLTVDRPSAIRYRSVIPEGKAMGPITLDYLNTEDGPVVTRRIPAVAHGEATTPAIVTRAEWNADEGLKRTSGSCRRTFHPVQQLFVHHTAGTNGDVDGAATMRAIYWYHTRRQGWCDIGYNFIIDWDGTIFEGRWARNYGPWEVHTSENLDGEVVTGAHVAGFNSGSVGISLMGNFERARLPRAMKRSLVRLLAWEVDRHNLDPTGAHVYRNPDTGRTRWLRYIAGHRDAGQTACPGDGVYSKLRRIRRQVARRIGPGKEATMLTLQHSARRVPYGSPVTFSGALITETGRPLRGRTVELYRRQNGRWGAEPHASVVTDATGSFSYTETATRTFTLRAAFDGGESVWGDQSRNRKVTVAHEVTLSAPDGAPQPNGSLLYPSGTRSVQLTGTASPVHVGRDIVLRLRRIRRDGSLRELPDQRTQLAADGTFSHDLALPRDGRYRVHALYPKDRAHAYGRSEALILVVG